MQKSQIKSRERVRELAEVYTNEREVNAMLDLVPDIAQNIYSKFLEPACGNGNFLVKILERKMKTVANTHKTLKNYEFYSLKALSTIYAVDICPENVQESRERMFNEMRNYFSLYRNSDFISFEYQRAIKYILNKTIVTGNTIDPNNNIKFVDFVIPARYYFEEKTYLFEDLKNNNPKPIGQLPKIHYLKLGSERKLL